MNLQSAFAIVEEAQHSEPIQEKTDPRTSRAYHLGESLLTDLGDYSLGYPFLPEVSKQEQKPGQPLFAGIEKLIDQILFVADISCQQVRYEHIRERVFPVQCKHHRLLINP